MSTGPLRLLAVLRTDIVESTPFQLRVGDDVAIDALSLHVDLLQTVTRAHGGTVTSKQGDGIFAVFDSVSAAVRAGQEIQATNARHSRWTEANRFEIRMGVSVGELVEADGVFSGRPMIEAERLQTVAEPGQILCTAGAAAMTGGRLGDDLHSAGTRDLKGFEDPMAVLAIDWEKTRNPLAVLAPALERRPPTDFVGRELEFELLEGWWHEAIAGQPRIVLVEGEAGVGKSRIARELALTAHRAGAVSVLGPCQRDDGPYGALSRGLDHYVSRLRGQAGLLGPYAADLVPLVADLGFHLPDLVPPVRADSGVSERATVQRAIEGWLTAATADEPMLLLIDDLQWADERTLSVLADLAQRLVSERLLIVATMRPLGFDGQETARRSRELQRSDLVTRLTLGGLDRNATHSLIESMAGHRLSEPVEAAFAEQLWRHTDGNPFYVQAVLSKLAAKGELRVIDGRWTTGRDRRAIMSPPEVREAVLGQLVDLSNDDLPVLEAAALLGSDFSLTLLQRLSTGLGFSDLRAIEIAVRAGLVHELPGDADRYRFSHEIVRSVFETAVERDRQVKIHELAADAILDLSGGSEATSAAAISYHLSFSLDPAMRARAAAHAVTGAQAASHQHLFEQASSLFQRAIRLLEADSTPTNPALLGRALLGAGLAGHKAGDPTAGALLGRAVALAEEQGDGILLAKAALVRARGMGARLGAVDDEQVAALERSLRLMSDEPTALRSVVLASLGAELVYSTDRARQRELLAEAETMARQLDDPANLCKVLVLKGNSIWRPSTLAERLDISNELEQITRGQAMPSWRFAAANFGFQTSMEAGLMGRADVLLGRMEQLAERIEEPMIHWYVALRGCVRFATGGHLAEAAAAAERSLAAAKDSWFESEALTYYFAHQWLIHYHRGELEAVEKTFQIATAGVDARPVFRPALAAIHAETGDLDGCRSVLDLVDEHVFDLDDQDLLVTAAVTAIAANASGDSVRAQLAHDILLPYRGQMIDNASTHFGSVSHYLGLATAAIGRPEEGLELLREAEGVHQATGSDPMTFRSRVEIERLRLDLEPVEDAPERLALLDKLRGECLTRGYGGPARAAARVLDRCG